MKKSIFACTLAAQIRNANTSMSRSEAMASAWKIVNEAKPSFALLTFQTVSGKIQTRVVSENWTAYTEVTGTGKAKPENLQLFADLGKNAVGKHCIISTYTVLNLVRLAA